MKKAFRTAIFKRRQTEPERILCAVRWHLRHSLSLRDAAAAKHLFRKALTDPPHPQPRIINTDPARLYYSAISGVQKEGILRRRCRHRPILYLSNILEQDHQVIKRRVKATQGFRESHAERRTIQGYEAMHMIRKGQARQIQRPHTLVEIAT